MSKSKKRQFEEFSEDSDYEDDEFTPYERNKFKEKRLKRALKTKNIDDLMDLDDYE